MRTCDLLIRDVCELEPANENFDDELSIRLSDLEVIVDRYVGKLEKAIAVYCRENFNARQFETDEKAVEYFISISSEDF